MRPVMKRGRVQARQSRRPQTRSGRRNSWPDVGRAELVVRSRPDRAHGSSVITPSAPIARSRRLRPGGRSSRSRPEARARGIDRSPCWLANEMPYARRGTCAACRIHAQPARAARGTNMMRTISFRREPSRRCSRGRAFATRFAVEKLAMRTRSSARAARMRAQRRDHVGRRLFRVYVESHVGNAASASSSVGIRKLIGGPEEAGPRGHEARAHVPLFEAPRRTASGSRRAPPPCGCRSGRATGRPARRASCGRRSRSRVHRARARVERPPPCSRATPARAAVGVDVGLAIPEGSATRLALPRDPASRSRARACARRPVPSGFRHALYERLFPRFRPKTRAQAPGQRRRLGRAITWLGTAGFVIESPETKLLVDPFITRRLAHAPDAPDVPRRRRDRTPRPRKVDAVLCGHASLRSCRRRTAHREAHQGEARRLRIDVRVGRAEGLPESSSCRSRRTARIVRFGDIEVRFVPSRHGKIVLRIASRFRRGARHAARPRTLLALSNGRRVRTSHQSAGRDHLPQRSADLHRRRARRRARGRPPRVPRRPQGRPRTTSRRPRQRARAEARRTDPSRRVLRAARARPPLPARHRRRRLRLRGLPRAPDASVITPDYEEPICVPPDGRARSRSSPRADARCDVRLLRICASSSAIVRSRSRSRSCSRASEPAARRVAIRRCGFYTLETQHFRITYHTGLEDVAQHVASTCREHLRAHDRARWDTTPRRDKTEIVLTDSAESANGSATALPYNAIRLLVTAPEDMSPLGDVDDWYLELVTHEYTHILHTDHIRGIPALVNAVLGKTLAPNQVQPRWILEGLGVYQESARTSAGRLRNSQWDMFMRADVLEDNVATLDQISNIVRRWPQGNLFYLYGSLLHRVDRARRTARQRSRNVSHDYGGQLIPWGIQRSIRRATGKTYDELYPLWIDSMKRALRRAGRERAARRASAKASALTHHGQIARYPRWIPKNAWPEHAGGLLYYRDDQHSAHRALRARPPARRRRERRSAPTRRTPSSSPARRGESVASFLPDGGLVFSSAEFYRNVFVFGDLERMAPGGEEPLRHAATGSRTQLTDGDARRRSDGLARRPPHRLHDRTTPARATIHIADLEPTGIANVAPARPDRVPRAGVHAALVSGRNARRLQRLEARRLSRHPLRRRARPARTASITTRPRRRRRSLASPPTGDGSTSTPTAPAS